MICPDKNKYVDIVLHDYGILFIMLILGMFSMILEFGFDLWKINHKFLGTKTILQANHTQPPQFPGICIHLPFIELFRCSVSREKGVPATFKQIQAICNLQVLQSV
ncbi:uncharacterized protein LOC113361752 [Papaver somniferum]|uniref:uncharacterized protein LOC113361752 n=1 Tax=Papaver somniferum TaxID=3469 RepID=UPI000E6FEB4B|nr:uncharacterized protein LOC113361752 [Papaver somniferum]